MARGQSGRIVLEVDVDLKNGLYARLEEDKSTLRTWFIERAQAYIGSPRNKAVQLSMQDLLKKRD
jgi:hypothetical protein